MRKLLLLFLFAPLSLLAQNTTTLPSSTVSVTPQWRVESATSEDSTRKYWTVTPGAGTNRMITFTEFNKYLGKTVRDSFLNKATKNFSNVSISTVTNKVDSTLFRTVLNSWTKAQADTRYVPLTRTVAGFALSSDVTLASLSAGYGLSAAGTYTGATARTFSIDSATLKDNFIRNSATLQTGNFNISGVARSERYFQGGPIILGSNYNKRAVLSFDATDPVGHTYNDISTSRIGYTSTNSTRFATGILGVSIVKATNTADWTNSSYSQLTGIIGQTDIETGSSGTIRRAAGIASLVGGNGSGAIVDEGILFDGDFAGTNINYAVGAKLTTLGIGTNNTGIFLAIQQSDRPHTGNYALYDSTGYKSHLSALETRGLDTYQGNYHASFTTRSKIDKSYADSVYAPIGGGGSFITVSQVAPQTLGTTGNRLTKLWATDITVTNAITGSVTGSAASLTTPRTIGTITGDATSAGNSFDGTANNTNALTFATVNSNVGSFGSATQVGTFTVTGKGLVTAAGNTTITPAIGSITGLGTGVATALGTNVGSAGAFIIFNDNAGTPSALVGTNITGLPLTTGVTGTLPIANGGTGVTTGAINNNTSLQSSSSYNIDGLASITKAGIGTTITDALLLVQSTAATVGAQKISPAMHFRGNAWNTTGSTSESSDFINYIVPVQGTTPSANMLWRYSRAGGSFATALTLTSGGNLTSSTGNFTSYGVGANTSNLAMGDNALAASTGSSNVGIGLNAGRFNVTGTGNVAIGRGALLGVTGNSNSSNTAVGFNALTGITTGGLNVAMGTSAAQSITSGSNNTIIGEESGTGMTTAANNVAVGYMAGQASTGDSWVAVGSQALYSNTSAKTGTVAIGSNAMGISSGTYNTAIGYQAGYYSGNTLTGNNNIFIGANGTQGIITGSYNTIIGTNTSIGDVSNTIILADGQSNNRLIFDNTGAPKVPFLSGSGSRILLTDNSGNVTGASALPPGTTASTPSGSTDVANKAYVDAAAGTSGTYTPTITNGANVASSTGATAHYMRIANQVHVQGKVNVTPTLGVNTTTVINISLPVASNIGAVTDLLGGAFAGAATAANPVATGDTTNDNGILTYISVSVGAVDLYFDFTYTII